MTQTPPAPVQSHPGAPTPPADQQPAGPKPKRSLPAMLLLFVGVPLLLLLIGAVVVVATWASPVSLRYTATGGSTVAVDVPNARLDFTPSADGDVHVVVTGWRTGPEPALSVTTSADVTTIEGGCPASWFSRCTLQIAVSVPAAADLEVDGSNGAISVAGLDGAVALGTDNGALSVDDVGGPLDLRTTNGEIRVTDGRSDTVQAGTTNGRIELEFSEAPTTVEAATTNGAVAVRVPDGSYFLDAQTTNGPIDTDRLPSDRFADRTITVQTTNGGVTIEPTP
jgi:hypothetical protein